MRKFKSLKKRKINLKFHSLTMRIWTTFTAIILLIILGISFIYLVIFRRINNEAKMNDLKVAHDMIVESDNIYEPNRLNELHNLMQSRHFIVQKDDETTNIVPIQNKMLLPDKGIEDKALYKGSIRDNFFQDKGIHYDMPFSKDRSLQQWMSSFADSKNLNDTEYQQKYNGKKYNFVISYVKDDKGRSIYLISYNPELNDNRLIYYEIVIGLIFIIIGFITSKIVASSIAKPLKKLEDYTVKIAKKEWGTPIEISSKDEIGRLAESMNKMQIELKRADEEEKMFLQSISHDLKTPVMVIMSHAEAIMDGIYIDSVEKTAEIIKNEAVSLDKKIRQMLYLNTLDYVMQNDEDDTDINLKYLITHIVSRLELINSSISWELDLDDVIVHGNMERFQVAIENIIENGLRYASDTIRISAHMNDDNAEIQIYNDGPNIDEDHINDIFDNQYKDKSGNFGLGLAISKKVINFYRGIVYAQNEDVGVTFVIKIKR